jgi:exodeoxyribonuclease VII small subunit
MGAKKQQDGSDFEQQLAELEALVRRLESGELGLEEGVERYGEGVELLKRLNSSLGAAEQKVEALTESLRRELAELEQDDAGGNTDD